MGLGSFISNVAGNLLGSAGSYFENKSINDQNKDMQYDFAKNGIKWKVDDAKAAGIHPLAALGAQTISPTASFQPSQAFANMGQDLSRAIHSTRSSSEREQATLMSSLQVENQQLQNDMLRSQIAKLNASPNPPFPSSDSLLLDGQGNSRSTAGTKTVPVEVSSHLAGQPARAAGTHPDMTYVNTGSGGLAIVPSKDAKNLIEDQFVPEMMWAARNHLTTFITPPPYPSDVPVPKGYDRWKWNPLMQEWRPSKGSSSSLRDSWRGFVDRVRKMPVKY